MDFFSMFFSDTASIVFNVIIVFFGCVMFFKYWAINNELRVHKNKYDDELSQNEGQATASVTSEDVSMGNYAGDVSERFMDRFISEYSKYEARCNSYGQLVSLFPMVGLLGTVVGLMSQINAQGIEALTSSISIALTTTCSAILFAIFLKFYDALKIVRSLSEIELIIARYQRKFEYTTTREQLNR